MVSSDLNILSAFLIAAEERSFIADIHSCGIMGTPERETENSASFSH